MSQTITDTARYSFRVTWSPEDAEFIAHARTDVPALVAALRAVLELHAEAGRGSDTYCTHCFPDCFDYPCPTVTAIRQHLGDEQ